MRTHRIGNMEVPYIEKVIHVNRRGVLCRKPSYLFPIHD